MVKMNPTILFFTEVVVLAIILLLALVALYFDIIGWTMFGILFVMAIILVSSLLYIIYFVADRGIKFNEGSIARA
jgi:hypothetical protein